MGHGGDVHLVLQVQVARHEVLRVHPQLSEHRLELLVQLVVRDLVGLRVAESDAAVAFQGDPVIRPGQVLGAEPKIDRVLRQQLQRPQRRQLGDVLFAPEHGRLRLANHLDVAERVVGARSAEVEIVEAQRLLIAGRVRFLRDGKDGLIVVGHVIAAHLIRAVGEPARVLVVGRGEQQAGRVGGAAGDHDDLALIALVRPVVLDVHLRHRGAGGVRLELQGAGAGEQRDVRELQRGADTEHVGVGLRVDEAREPVTVDAADALRKRHVVFGQHDPARGVERLVASPYQIVVELLNARLVRDRRERIRATGGRLGGILAARAVDLVQVLGPHVIGLEVGVRDRPGRGNPVLVAELSEVALAQAIERGAVHLGRAPHEVVHARLEGLAVLVVPGVLGDVAVFDEYVLDVPVFPLSLQPVAALEQQDALAQGGELRCQRAAAGPGPDDDDVVDVSHGRLPSPRRARRTGSRS